MFSSGSDSTLDLIGCMVATDMYNVLTRRNQPLTQRDEKMTTATKPKPTALIVDGIALVSLDTKNVMLNGTLTLEAAKKFVGKKIEVWTGMAHEIKAVTLESVTQNSETGDITFWAVGDRSYHLRVVAKS